MWVFSPWWWTRRNLISVKLVLQHNTMSRVEANQPINNTSIINRASLISFSLSFLLFHSNLSKIRHILLECSLWRRALFFGFFSNYKITYECTSFLPQTPYDHYCSYRSLPCHYFQLSSHHEEFGTLLLPRWLYHLVFRIWFRWLTWDNHWAHHSHSPQLSSIHNIVSSSIVQLLRKSMSYDSTK